MVRVIPMSAGQTALSGTAGADTAIGGGNFTIPTWAKSILGYSLAAQADLPTAAQSIMVRSAVVSDNVPIQPMEGLAAPLSGILGASGNGPVVGGIESYAINLRVSGGEQITPNMRGLTTMTTVYGMMAFICSDASPIETQRHIKAGTLTTGTSVSAERAGTPYAITSARNILELLGEDAPATVAGSEGSLSRIRFTSTEFAGVNQVDLLLNPAQAGLATLQAASIGGGVSRQKCNVPIQPVSQCNISDSIYTLSSTTLATAVPWVSAVVYEI